MASVHQAGGGRARADAAAAAAIFVSLLLLYLFTLLPGLGGTEDTPKFQYIGAVLGTAHEPGYPLYVMLTYAWSHLPLGTLAHRINAFSSLWGAAACVFAFLAMRKLEVHRWTAAVAAVAMGVGRTFWQHAVIAEVYSLAAALTVAAVLALLSWDESRRSGWLYAAVAAASLAFGAHLIVVGALPALLLFTLAACRWRLPWRVLLVSALIVLAGIAQYGYVWVRTIQHAPYLEARAERVADLVNVLRAKQFESTAFTDAPGVVAARRIPAALREVRVETGAGAAAFAVVGALFLLRRRPRHGVLVAGAAAGQLLLLAMLGDVAVGAIALPAVALAWILAACGVDGIRLALQRVAPAWLATTVAVASAAVIAVSLAAGNFAANDHRRDTYDTDYMRALFDNLPPKAAFVFEHYSLHHMIEYEKVVTGRASDVATAMPRPESIEPLLAGGVPVLAFAKGRDLVAPWYLTKPVGLFGLTLDERLTPLPNGYVVIVCGTADRWPDLGALGVSRGQLPRGAAAIIAVKGEGVIARSTGSSDGRLVIPAGQRLGRTGAAAPAEIEANAASGRAEIVIGGQQVIQSRTGLVIVEMGSRVRSAYSALPERGMRVPVDMGPRPLFEVRAAIPVESCTELESGQWTPLKRFEGSQLLAFLDTRQSARAELDLYFAASAPLAVKLGETFGAGSPEIAVEQFAQGSTFAQERTERLRLDGAPPLEALTLARTVTRVGVRVVDKGEFSAFSILPGGFPQFAMARGRVDPPAAMRARVCALPLEPLEFSGTPSEATVHLGPGGDKFFGRGWGRTRATVAGVERELVEPDAELLVPLASPGRLTFRLQLGLNAGGGAAEALVNGRSLGVVPYAAGWAALTWEVPATAWIDGLNRVTLHIAGGPLPRVRRIDFARPEIGARQ